MEQGAHGLIVGRPKLSSRVDVSSLSIRGRSCCWSDDDDDLGDSIEFDCTRTVRCGYIDVRTVMNYKYVLVLLHPSNVWIRIRMTKNIKTCKWTLQAAGARVSHMLVFVGKLKSILFLSQESLSVHLQGRSGLRLAMPQEVPRHEGGRDDELVAAPFRLGHGCDARRSMLGD